MSDPRKEQQPYEEEESDFGSKLKVRLAIAGGLVALALAAIPILDSLTGKPTAATDNGAGSIVSSAGLAATPASAPVASAPVASAPAASAPVGTAPTGPNLAQTPGMTATPPLSLPAPPPAEQPAAHAAGSKPHQAGAAKPAPHDNKAFKPAPATVPPYAQQPYAPTVPPYAPAANAAPAQHAALPPQPAASQTARPAGTSIGYNVQLGLFNNLDNAQKLITELRSKGIDVQSETRVHLPPFRTRAEAEQAMAKLRALGYAPMLNAVGN
jgi:DedD protein